MDRDDVKSRYTRAARQALEHFPVEAESLNFVSQSENVTFRVSVRGSGTDYALRLHRPGYSSIEELESERIWVRALRDSGVAVQESIETQAGGHYALVDIASAGERRYAGMTTWLAGAPLRDFLEASSDAPERQRIFKRFGEIAASLHNQSTRWKPPLGFVRRRLDHNALLGDTPFWGRFWEHPDLTADERSTLLRARGHARAAVGAYGETSENFSLIHADLTLDNIVYDGHRLAVIDFDDAAYGWHMYDIASALIESRFDADFESLRDSFLDGYQSCRPLAKRDIDRLPLFELIRGMAIIGWFYQRPEHAGTAYFEQFKNWVIEECNRKGY